MTTYARPGTSFAFRPVCVVSGLRGAYKGGTGPDAFAAVASFADAHEVLLRYPYGWAMWHVGPAGRGRPGEVPELVLPGTVAYVVADAIAHGAAPALATSQLVRELVEAERSDG